MRRRSDAGVHDPQWLRIKSLPDRDALPPPVPARRHLVYRDLHPFTVDFDTRLEGATVGEQLNSAWFAENTRFSLVPDRITRLELWVCSHACVIATLGHAA